MLTSGSIFAIGVNNLNVARNEMCIRDSRAGGRLAYADERAEFLPGELPPGIFAAGRVAGTHALSLIHI